jgi:hypothetical protein
MTVPMFESQVETDALRALLDKPVVSDVTSAMFGRVQGAVIEAVRGVGIANLRLVPAVIQKRQCSDPGDRRTLQVAGVPQAVRSRGLPVAGREPDTRASL